MGGLCNTPTPPPAPDPVAVANAQADANTRTAQEQQKLNMINTTGPQGSVTYQADPNAPGGYTQVTALSPAQQAILDSQQKTELGAVQTAQDQLGRVNTALATPLDTSGLPDIRYGHNFGQEVDQLAPGQIQTSFNGGQPLQYSFDQGQAVQGQVGPQDLNGAYKSAADASYQQAASRLDPQWSKQQEQLETQLANQGFSQNSQGYKDALDAFNRQKADAYNQAQLSSQNQGLTAENTLFGQSVQQGQFANQAAGQMYSQNQGAAAFHNQTSGQDFSQNQAQAQFANSAEAQRFQEAAAAAQAQEQARIAGAQQNNTARQQALQERAYIQNEPINQLTGLLGLGQVSNPTGVNYTPVQVGNTDVIGANALSTQAKNANYQAQMNQQNGLMGGLFSLGAAGIQYSDRRLKTDIRRIGTRKDGLGVYLYTKAGRPEFGVMAQEVAKVRPDAVVRMPNGYLGVNYMQLEAA